MEIIGHDNIWRILKKTAEAGKLSHAYLFFGPDRIGKKDVALKFIKFLNCEEKDLSKRPCCSCRACRDIQRNSFPDFSLTGIGPEEKEIKISQIRDLNWRLSLQSYSAPFKSAIINEAHMMNKSAQSALLKTLEEPKGQTIIILVTAFPRLLLPTIVSRTERVRFSPVPKKEIKKYLEKKGIGEEKVKELLSIYLGKPGNIIDFVTNSEKLKERNKRIKELTVLIESPLSDRFKYAKENSEDPKKVNRILDVWLEYFREKLIASVSGQTTGNYSLKKLKKIIDLIQNVSFLVSKTGVDRKLAMEMLLLEL